MISSDDLRKRLTGMTSWLEDALSRNQIVHEIDRSTARSYVESNKDMLEESMGTTSTAIVCNGIQVTIERSEEDGELIVQIDTPEELEGDGGEPRLRIHLNDWCMHNGTALHDGKAGW